jgi:elongation factor P hydroxylase
MYGGWRSEEAMDRFPAGTEISLTVSAFHQAYYYSADREVFNWIKIGQSAKLTTRFNYGRC